MRVHGLAVLMTVPGFLFAQVRPTQPANQPGTQRLQNTRDMHVACVGADSTRTFRRGVGDTLSTSSRLTGGDSVRTVTGGTERSRQYPEFDVVLDVPNLCVERIFLKVDSLTAKINLHAQVANLVTVRAGADVLIGNVDLTIQDVRARALLLVDLDDVVHIVDQTLTFIDNNPQIVQQLGSTLQGTVGAVGGLVRGLVLGVTRLANGNSLQRIVDQATGNILERTLSAAGGQLAERIVGNVLRLPTLRETTNTAGQAVRQVRDTAGSLLEYTLDKATNKVLGVRLLQAAAGAAR
ncbi:MAG TPA: hypothetical protein VEB19_08940 [Gemmatimonadaceae bacterium]|nr:hypothetical protein [Gemmatimonadaceae bacterium]